MKKIILVPALLSMLVTGCAGFGKPGYECELKPNPTGKCASMSEAYKAAGRIQGSSLSRQSVFDNPEEARLAAQAAANRPFFRGENSGYPDQNEQGMPVFRQPQVHRVWVAPYVDADGNLRSGEYTYFATPGAWNYGTTRRAGQASGIFGPAKPGNYGFNPVDKEKLKAAPPAPASTAKVTPPQGQNAGNTNEQQPATNQNVDGVTQPVQRF